MPSILTTTLFDPKDEATWPAEDMPVLVFERERRRWEQMSFRMDGPYVEWRDAHGDYDDGLDEDSVIRWANLPADPFDRT